MTAADELRTAAEKIRALAASATDGPWKQSGIGDDGWTVDTPELFIAETEDSEKGRADADWIATMHPGVGRALADWLEFHAAMDERLLALVDGAPGMDEATWDGKPHPALTVARALLGGQP